jgi:hypothetical protein
MTCCEASTANTAIAKCAPPDAMVHMCAADLKKRCMVSLSFVARNETGAAVMASACPHLWGTAARLLPRIGVRQVLNSLFENAPYAVISTSNPKMIVQYIEHRPVFEA